MAHKIPNPATIRLFLVSASPIFKKILDQIPSDLLLGKRFSILEVTMDTIHRRSTVALRFSYTIASQRLS